MSKWITSQHDEVPEALLSLVGGHQLLAQALARRGITTVNAARAFLDPSCYQPSPATDLPGIEAAGERLLDAIRRQERICVWGDFDVDGQTATTLLVSALNKLGAEVCYYIPVRARESHGVHLAPLKQLIDAGARVILTCDTGIAAHEAAEYARSRGVDFLVTDHHELPPVLPEAYSLTNPQMLPAGHPLRTLPGVGVAFKLTEHILSLVGKAEQAEEYLDLAALGIVADVALLNGETRFLLQLGLRALSQPERAGLVALMDVAGLNPVHITEEHIGFLLAPRLNALGRLGDANSIVELLTTHDQVKAKLMALELEGLNAQRQLLTNQVFQAAQAQIDREPGLLEKPVLVLSSPTWPAGILGIVASRLVEQYHLPAVLISTPSNEPGRGSARSVEGVHITQAIAEQADYLVSYGGHAMAAGLAILPDHIPAFYAGLSKSIARQSGGAKAEKQLTIDATIPLADITLELVNSLEMLAPFGPGNPPLIFAANNLTIQSKRTIGRNAEHLLISVQDQTGNSQEVIWWQGAGWQIPEGMFDLAFTLHSSNYRGQPGIQVQWIEAKESATQPVALKAKPVPLLVQDYRDIPFPQAQIRLLKQEPGVTIWREADTFSSKLEGEDRLNLSPNPTLAIYTSPPGRAELDAAIERVKPSSILLFAQDPGMDQPAVFLERLAGLAKYALNHRQGKAELAVLAAATAQREPTVLAGLEWLQAKGVLVYRHDRGDISLFRGDTPDPGRLIQAEIRLKANLQESAAFRAYLRRVEPEMLFGDNIETSS